MLLGGVPVTVCVCVLWNSKRARFVLVGTSTSPPHTCRRHGAKHEFHSAVTRQCIGCFLYYLHRFPGVFLVVRRIACRVSSGLIISSFPVCLLASTTQPWSQILRSHASHTLIVQSADAKKEEFRKYLEKSGVIDALTKVLVGLYEEPERPQSAVDYVRKYLGSSSTANVDVDALRNENEELRNRIRELSRTVEDLKKGNSR